MLATIPVVIAGYFVNYADWHWLDMVQTLAIANLGFAIILWLSDNLPIKKHGLRFCDMASCTFNWRCPDLCAYSGGITFGCDYKCGPFLGYDRITAARLSLLLSLPTITGAGLLKSLDLVQTGDAALGSDVAIVIVLSAGLAWLAISWMMRWLAKASFGIFVYYRVALAPSCCWGCHKAG